MRASDLMTRTPLTIPPDMPLAMVARSLAERGISGAPVVDAAGTLLGMVTEGDLIRRLAAPEDQPHGWLRDFLTPAARQAARFARTHGQTARDVMSTGLVTATEATPVSVIAKAFEEHGIRRVPVVRDGKLVGIVSRADLIRVLMTPEVSVEAEAPDERILRGVLAALRRQPWSDAFFVFPEVTDGIVSFHGFCRSDEVQRALDVLARTVPGVRGVQMRTRRMPPPLSGA